MQKQSDRGMLMNKIIKKNQLAANVYQFVIESPLIANERRPGQFVIVQVNANYAERIPLTIADADAKAGTITLIFQVVGKTTHALAALEKGQMLENILGPLGRPTHIERVGTVVCVGGGIGVAPLYPITEGFKKAGNRVVVIIGARSKELLILEEKMRNIADELIVTTDDGSYGKKAFVTEPLKEVCERTEKPSLCVAIGPPIMMKNCANVTRPFGVQTMVSLNTIMVDGTGMCGGCRVTVGNETKFVCVDGPEFDGHKVDFDNMMLRLSAYRDFERRAHENCLLEKEVKKLEGKHA
jgi:ferredoxin--NADP+ reductase